MDREALRKAVGLKREKDGNSNNNSVGQNNPNNQIPIEINSTEVFGEIQENVPNVPLSNLGVGTLESPKSGTNGTFSYIPPNTSVEFGTEESEQIEGEDIAVTNNEIIIKGGDKHKLEIFYGYTGFIEDSKRIINLKVPQLPQFEFIAKKKEGVLKLVAIIDFYQDSGRSIYYIRNKNEIIEKLYAFRGHRSISKRLIGDALENWLYYINPEKYIKWADIRDVVKEYPEWTEINQDPLNFFLSRANNIVGNEKLKVAVLLSVLSSQLAKTRGIYRVHLILTGSSGSGKSSTIKSILDLFYDNADGVEDFVVLKLTRMTKEALGRINVDTLDGKVMFVEQLDNVEGVDYVREAMSEDRITTLTTVKDEEGNLTSKTIVIPGQPAFMTTNVTTNIDHQILNRSIQLYLSPAEDEKLKSKIIETILERGEISTDEMGRLKLITYVWLKTRPNSPKMTKEVKEELAKLLVRFINFRNIYRATEITRNLVRASASLLGHEEIQKDDVDFIMNYFKKDIILTTLELSERDLQLLRWLRDHGFIQGEKEDETKDVTTPTIAQVAKMSTQETKRLLDTLYDKGLLWKAYDGKRFSWAIAHYGLRVLDELEKEVEEGEQQGQTDVIIEDQLLAYISSKLMVKDKVTEEELRGILEKTAYATDQEAQDLLIQALEKKGIIKNEGEGVWKVL